jgi:dienelactone hydrolase
LNGALAAAAEWGANVEHAVALGYCFGGSAVLEWARAGVELKGVAPFHGGLATPDGQDYSKTTTPIIVFHGTADQMISMAEFAGLAEELEAAGVTHEMITYSGAVHAFSVFDNPERYQAEADRKSWERFTRFLEEVL